MLYQIYETQRALMAPFAEFASASAKLYDHPLSPFAHLPWAQRVSAGFDLVHRLAKEYEKPPFEITTATVNDAAVESISGDSAVVLVSATSRREGPKAPKDQQQPRVWRVVLNLQRDGGQIKMTGVEFV